MDASDYHARNAKLREAVVLHSESTGAELIESSLASSDILVHWIHYLHSSVSKEHANSILLSVKSSIIESTACTALGLVRPAIFAMRVQMELLLAWIYFNDHRVEWEVASGTPDQYPMYSQNKKYLPKYGRKFNKRFAMLKDHKTRSSNDQYDLLSIHVHALTTSAMPMITDLNSIVQPCEKAYESIKLQAEVTEYLADILGSWFADNWADFPPAVMEGINVRLSSAKRKEFFG